MYFACWLENNNSINVNKKKKKKTKNVTKYLRDSLIIFIFYQNSESSNCRDIQISNKPEMFALE